jgi:hypothetical protein
VDGKKVEVWEDIYLDDEDRDSILKETKDTVSMTTAIQER